MVIREKRNSESGDAGNGIADSSKRVEIEGNVPPLRGLSFLIGKPSAYAPG
jgi:hypothetical protein